MRLLCWWLTAICPCLGTVEAQDRIPPKARQIFNFLCTLIC
uniref:Uncharacterized protein n=1 Tax=Anguilla anguilla TaxID=7936 RepID=A0A0E9QSP6_ANGAN